MPTRDAERRPPHPVEDVEEELAAALPAPEGSRVLPLIREHAFHVVALVLLCAAGYILWREFRHISPTQVADAIANWGWRSIALACALSASSFFLMGIVEWLGLRWSGVRLSVPAALAGSFVANSIAHTLGASMIVSGAVRARFYAKYGVTLRQVAATTVFDSLAFAVGLSTLAGSSLLLAGSRDIAHGVRIAHPIAYGVGIALLTFVLAYVLLCGYLRRPLSGFGHSIKLPTAGVALAQIALGALDNAVAASIIWTLLPHGSITFFTFVGGYAPSVVLGQISHVPGGVGVFEGSLSTLVKGIDPAALAASFLGYRLFFYFAPLAIGSLALAADTLQQRRRA